MNRPIPPLLAAVLIGTSAGLFFGYWTYRSEPVRQEMESTGPSKANQQQAFPAKNASTPPRPATVGIDMLNGTEGKKLPLTLEKDEWRVTWLKDVPDDPISVKSSRMEYLADWVRVLCFICERKDMTPINPWTPQCRIFVQKRDNLRLSEDYGMEGLAVLSSGEYITLDQSIPVMHGIVFQNGLQYKKYAERCIRHLPKIAPHQVGIIVLLHGGQPETVQPTIRISFEKWLTQQKEILEFPGLPVPPKKKHCSRPDCALSQVLVVGKEMTAKDQSKVRVEKIAQWRTRPRDDLSIVASVIPKENMQDIARQNRRLGITYRRGAPPPSVKPSAIDDKGRTMKGLTFWVGDDLYFEEAIDSSTKSVQSARLQPPSSNARTFTLKFPLCEEKLAQESPKFEFNNVQVEKLLQSRNRST